MTVGIDSEAIEVDFTTLIARMDAFDYQMLELGWSFTGYTECVSLLFDVIRPDGQLQLVGLLVLDVYENPYYASIGGVSTLADDATQDLVDALYDLEMAARSTSSTSSIRSTW